MPALEIAPDNNNQIEQRQEVEVPEVRGLTVTDAVKLLKEAGLDANINGEGEINKDEVKVKDQIPKPGLNIYIGTKIEIYT